MDNLQDNVLYLKHNLNASAISAIKGELATIDRDVTALIATMEAAIAESEGLSQCGNGSAVCACPNN